MEQDGGQNQPQQPQAPLECPRCSSKNTKFRYFNNHDVLQPRHYCRDCKRMWTVGGNLRNIPVGGTTRNKQTKAPPISVDSSFQIQPPQLPTFPQNFDAIGNQPLTNFQKSIAPMHSFYLNNEFTNLGAIDSPIQPEVNNEVVNVMNQVGFGSANTYFMQGWDNRFLAPEQGFPQQIQGYGDHSNAVNRRFVELNQFHDEAGSSYNLPNHDLNQYMPSVLDNFHTNTTNNDLPSTGVHPNPWSWFPGHGPL